MRPIGLDVEDVVPEVDATGAEAEGDEHHEGLAELVGLIEQAGGTRRSKDEDVLDPLLRARGSQDGVHVDLVRRSAQR